VGDPWASIVRQLARSVKERRLAHDLSQADLARDAGVSRRRIQQIEEASDVHNPSLRVLLRLATALNTSVADLLAADQARLPRPRKETPKP